MEFIYLTKKKNEIICKLLLLRRFQVDFFVAECQLFPSMHHQNHLAQFHRSSADDFRKIKFKDLLQEIHKRDFSL